MIDSPIEVNIKFPKGMSQRDKKIIAELLYREFNQRPPTTKEEAYLRTRAYIEEFLCLGTKHHNKPKGKRK